MPIFDTECPGCGKKDEVIILADEELPVCECGTKTEKVMSPLGHRKPDHYEFWRDR